MYLNMCIEKLHAMYQSECQVMHANSNSTKGQDEVSIPGLLQVLHCANHSQNARL